MTGGAREVGGVGSVLERAQAIGPGSEERAGRRGAFKHPHSHSLASGSGTLQAGFEQEI